jgi:hypothetical protein
MSTAVAELYAFAYGEHLEGLAQRSLGYRMLAPAQPAPWSAEVEALARQLQTAPYPDHWPPTELFCSVLLTTGERLVAVARYGLADHTPGHRRGGLELVGVVGPSSLDVTSAFSLYQWLKQRRALAEDLHTLGGTVALAEVLAAMPPTTLPRDPAPVLPVRLWQEGALLFAATTPSEPDHRLTLLEQSAGGAWQWLPFVGADFPVPNYVQRGPLVAWAPHLAGVALKLDHKPINTLLHATRRGRGLVNALSLALLAVLLLLSCVQLWLTLSLGRQVATVSQAPREGQAPPDHTTLKDTAATHPASGEEARERFARALYDLLTEKGGRREWGRDQTQLLAQYQRLARDHKDLQLRDSNTEGKLAVGAVEVLSQRSTDRVEDLVRKALSDKGFHPNVVKTACDFVHEQLSADSSGPH